MGADGGYQWLEVTNKSALKELVWMLWRYQNNNCWAIKHAKEPEGLQNPGVNWLEGGYGTDCDYDFRSLLDFIDYCIVEDDPVYCGTDPRHLTFAELEEDLLTDPEFNLWAWKDYGLSWNHWDTWWKQKHWGPIMYGIATKLRVENPNPTEYAPNPWPEIYVPKNLRNTTVQEWAQQVKALLPGGHIYQETWT